MTKNSHRTLISWLLLGALLDASCLLAWYGAKIPDALPRSIVHIVDTEVELRSGESGSVRVAIKPPLSRAVTMALLPLNESPNSELRVERLSLAAGAGNGLFLVEAIPGNGMRTERRTEQLQVVVTEGDGVGISSTCSSITVSIQDGRIERGEFSVARLSQSAIKLPVGESANVEVIADPPVREAARLKLLQFADSGALLVESGVVDLAPGSSKGDFTVKVSEISPRSESDLYHPPATRTLYLVAEGGRAVRVAPDASSLTVSIRDTGSAPELSLAQHELRLAEAQPVAKIQLNLNRPMATDLDIPFQMECPKGAPRTAIKFPRSPMVIPAGMTSAVVDLTFDPKLASDDEWQLKIQFGELPSSSDVTWKTPRTSQIHVAERNNPHTRRLVALIVTDLTIKHAALIEDELRQVFSKLQVGEVKQLTETFARRGVLLVSRKLGKPQYWKPGDGASLVTLLEEMRAHCFEGKDSPLDTLELLFNEGRTIRQKMEKKQLNLIIIWPTKGPFRPVAPGKNKKLNSETQNQFPTQMLWIGAPESDTNETNVFQMLYFKPNNGADLPQPLRSASDSVKDVIKQKLDMMFKAEDL